MFPHSLRWCFFHYLCFVTIFFFVQILSLSQLEFCPIIFIFIPNCVYSQFFFFTVFVLSHLVFSLAFFSSICGLSNKLVFKKALFTKVFYQQTDQLTAQQTTRHLGVLRADNTHKHLLLFNNTS